MKETLRNPDRITKQGERKYTRWVYEKEFNKPLGVDANGDILTKVRVVVDRRGIVVTGFPQKDFK
ncbi:hypothetical protein [Risungbinella massiliensis]|uniref:hypothetical protein n=1 Tax=Risungbinella massiliensis TaxID=1329796 RepID=UPI0005CB98BC|nr:hypothetical protein [Risungbinella massiliensis]